MGADACPCLLALGSIWRCALSFTPRPYYPRSTNLLVAENDRVLGFCPSLELNNDSFVFKLAACFSPDTSLSKDKHPSLHEHLKRYSLKRDVYNIFGKLVYSSVANSKPCQESNLKSPEYKSEISLLFDCVKR